MATKAQLETENEILKELVDCGTTIRDCNFQGSPSGDVCSAVEAIAGALRVAGKALESAPMLNIEAVQFKSNKDE